MLLWAACIQALIISNQENSLLNYCVKERQDYAKRNGDNKNDLFKESEDNLSGRRRSGQTKKQKALKSKLGSL